MKAVEQTVQLKYRELRGSTLEKSRKIYFNCQGKSFRTKIKGSSPNKQ